MSQQYSLLHVLLLLICHLSSVYCSTASPEAVAGIVCFVCFGLLLIVLLCYKGRCRHSTSTTHSTSTKEIPTIAVVEIPDRVTCPYCSGVSTDCPLATSPAYLHSHPQAAHEPPPSYSSLAFHECPTLQQTLEVPDNASGVHRPK